MESAKRRCRECGKRNAPHRRFKQNGYVKTRGYCRECETRRAKERRRADPHRDLRSIWAKIKSRCLNEQNPQFHYYGGRGIAVCDRWLIFEGFLEDMSPRPSSSHQIDRIDNNEGYSPENCRWATAKEQQRNKRSNVIITALGKSLTVEEWGEVTGFKSDTILKRITRLGWDGERAVTTPPRKNKRWHR